MVVHGGDLDAAVREYGLEKSKIKDFSANINPLGMPENVKRAIIENIGMISTYPDVNYVSLKGAIAKYVNVSKKNIVVGNGSTEIISLFIRSSAKNAVIVAPAYSEYEREIKLAGGTCKYFSLKEENSFNPNINDLCGHLTKDIGLLVMCNPNNPTGTAVTSADIEVLAEVCAGKQIQILIDETYCEFTDENKYSSVGLVNKYDNIMVIRGVAKFFASPGLRLGYGVCAEETAAKINAVKDPWSVNTLAAIAGEAFFSDIEYISRTKAFISDERRRVYKRLSEWDNIRVYESLTNFHLFRLLDSRVKSADVFETLIKKGIMIRDAGGFKFLDESYVRFCLLSREDNELLLNELRQLI